MRSFNFHSRVLVFMSLVSCATTRGDRQATRIHGQYHRDQVGLRLSGDSTDDNHGHNVFERPEIKSERDFVNYCQEWFLSGHENEFSNAFVSQGDLVDFLADICRTFDEEDIPEFDCPAPTFTTIDIDVQLVFVKHLCNVKVGEEMVTCLRSIVDKGNEFGHIVDFRKSPFAEELCCGLVPFISLVRLEQNSGCLHIPNAYPSPGIPSETTPSPNGSGQVTTPGSGPWPIATSSYAPTPHVVGPKPPSNPSSPSTLSEPSHSPSQSNGTGSSTKSPVPLGTNPTPPSAPIPMPSTGSMPTPTVTKSPSLNTSGNPTTEEPETPHNRGTPTDVENPVISEEEADTPNNQDNNVSAATITGIVLSLGGCFIAATAVSRRRARKRQESRFSASSPDETSDSSH